LDQLALWGVDRKALGVGMPNSPCVNGDLMGFIDDSGGVYSLGNKRIHFFCGKYFFLDTLAAVNIGYDKCPILETC